MVADISHDVRPLARSQNAEFLRSRLRVLARGWWIVAVCAGTLGVLYLLVALMQDPVYRASSQLYVTSGVDANATSAYQGSLASQQRVASYVRLATSDAVLDRAIRATAGDGADVAEARSAVSAETSPNTVMFSISADSKDATKAVDLANAVATALTQYVSTLEVSAEGGVPLAKLTVVSPAQVQSRPVEPRIERNLSLVLLLGVGIGVTILFVRDRLNTRVLDIADLGQNISATVLGSLPRDTEPNRPESFALGATGSAEAFRKIRTNLQFAGVDTDLKCILVSSARAGEGKTYTSIGLAASLVESGSTVLLVDADLRRPSVAKILGISNGVGLTDCLRGKISLPEAVQTDAGTGIAVLASGGVPPNPTELLNSSAMSTLVTKAKGAYDYVIIDGAPLLPVADSIVASRWADGVLLVSRAGYTRVSDIRACAKELASARAAIVGVVLNDVEKGGSYYYYHSTNVDTP